LPKYSERGSLAIHKGPFTLPAQTFFWLFFYVLFLFIARTYCVIFLPRLVEFAPFFAIVPVLILRMKTIPTVWKGSIQFWKNSCLSGTALSLLLYLMLYFVCLLLEGVGVEYSRLIQKEGEGEPHAMMTMWTRLVFEPILFQTFFTGMMLPRLIRKTNLFTFAYTGGILLAIGSFQINIGTFLLGAVTAGLFYRQKSLLAPTLFHANAIVAGILLDTIFLNAVPIVILLF